MTTTVLTRMNPGIAESEKGSSEQAQKLMESLGYAGLAEAQARESTKDDQYREKVINFLHEKSWAPYNPQSVFRYQHEQITAMQTSEKPHDIVTNDTWSNYERHVRNSREEALQTKTEADWRKEQALGMRTVCHKHISTVLWVEQNDFKEFPNPISGIYQFKAREVQLGEILEGNPGHNFAVAVDNAGPIYPWQWIDVPLSLYGMPVPFPVLQHAAAIKEKFPEAELLVEHLTNRNPLALLSRPRVAALRDKNANFLEQALVLADRERKNAEDARRRKFEKDRAKRAAEAARINALRKVCESLAKKVIAGKLGLDEISPQTHGASSADVRGYAGTLLLRDAAARLKQGKRIDFKKYGLTAREVHWYLYDPFLKLRLRYADGGFEDLHLFVWDEPGFQANILD